MCDLEKKKVFETLKLFYVDVDDYFMEFVKVQNAKIKDDCICIQVVSDQNLCEFWSLFTSHSLENSINKFFRDKIWTTNDFGKVVPLISEKLYFKGKEHFTPDDDEDDDESNVR